MIVCIRGTGVVFFLSMTLPINVEWADLFHGCRKHNKERISDALKYDDGNLGNDIGTRMECTHEDNVDVQDKKDDPSWIYHSRRQS